MTWALLIAVLSFRIGVLVERRAERKRVALANARETVHIVSELPA